MTVDNLERSLERSRGFFAGTIAGTTGTRRPERPSQSGSQPFHHSWNDWNDPPFRSIPIPRGMERWNAGSVETTKKVSDGIALMDAGILALATRCVDRGLLEPADLALIPGMTRDDRAGTLAWLEQMTGPEQRCTWCRHHRLPGGHVGYCAHSDARRRGFYAQLSQLPADHGHSCGRFQPDHGDHE